MKRLNTISVFVAGLLLALGAHGDDLSRWREQISAKDAELSQRDHEIAARNNTLKEVGDQIAAMLEQATKDAEEVERLTKLWKTTSSRIDELNKEVGRLRHDRDEIASKLEKAEKDTAAAQLQLDQLKEQEPHDLAAQGGSGGTTAVRSVTVPAGGHICRIEAFTDRDQLISYRFFYKTSDGAKHNTEWLGGSCGHGSEPEVLDLAPEERLVAIRMHGEKWCDTIEWITTDRVVSMGGDGDDEDRVEANTWQIGEPGTEIVGLYGKAGKYCDSLGLIVRKSDHNWSWK